MSGAIVEGSRLSRLWRGRPEDPAWARPALLALLAATALLYLIGLGASGWANAFYSAAVQAGTESWKAFFFGSSDAANFITVDKPPMSLWIMGLSARIFGVNSWSILVPQALMGVAAVGVLYSTVRRWHGPAAGLLAGAALALTPAAALMFRFNNPDALLVLLLTLAAWATVRALEKASARWLALAAVFIGCGFLTKMLQAFVLVPVVALVYLVAAPAGVRRRLWHVVLAGVALVVSSGWWVAIVELWPESSRPYIGGSQTNSVLELVFGYNGFGRITGNETGAVVPGGAAQAGAWGETGIWRMFDSSWGGQAAWLIPAALALGLAVLWITRRAPRTDRLRASMLLWGGWLVVTAAVFSFAQGIIHEYYAVALAPGIGGLVGIGSVELWRRRERLVWRLVLAAVVAGSAVWAYVLLGRATDWQPWLQPFVLIGGLAAAVLLALGDWATRRKSIATTVAAATVALLLLGPAAYSLQTASSAHTGSLPSAGPTVARAMGGPGGMGGRATAGGPGMGDGMAGPAPGSMSDGGTPPGDGTISDGGTPPGGTHDGVGGGSQTDDGLGRPGGTGGGLLDASTPSDELVALLEQDADSYTWVAAAVGAQAAAGYQLAAGEPVMSLGGFNGSDPYPTLEEFQALVQAGEIHYFIAGGTGDRSGTGDRGAGGPGGSRNNAMSAITAWVQAMYASTAVGGVTLYDLSGGTSTI